jgi:hypothetical protein
MYLDSQVKSATMALVLPHVGTPGVLRETGMRREQTPKLQGSAAHVRSDTSFVLAEKKNQMNALRGQDGSGGSSQSPNAQNASGTGGGSGNAHANAGSSETQNSMISKSSTVRDRAGMASDHRDASDKPPPPHSKPRKSLVFFAKPSREIMLGTFWLNNHEIQCAYSSTFPITTLPCFGACLRDDLVIKCYTCT